MSGREPALRRWWSTARSTWQVAKIESWVWVAVAFVGVLVRPLRESIPVLFFISCYANAKGAAAQAQGAKLEMQQEEAHH